MGEEQVEETAPAEAVDTQVEVDQVQEEKQVPLKALQAERRKRQDAEYQTQWMQEQLKTAQGAQQKPADDGDELLTKSDYTRMTGIQLAELKRQTLEETFLQDHPDIVDAVETDLPEILKKKPWLAHAISNSQNRYKTAHEILQDYKPKGENVRKRIQENSEKPGSPTSVGKGGEIVRDLSKMSRAEFSVYRKELRAKR